MRASRTLTLAALALLAAAPLSAQTAPAPRSPLVRADVYGTLGWFNADAGLRDSGWFNRSLHGAAGFGWYWTDHLRTAVEFAATTPAEVYSSELVTVAGQSTYLGFRQTFDTKRLGIGQYYQFYRNVWFHPHVAAGVDVTWETVQRIDEPVFVFDPVGRQGREGRPRREHSPVTSHEVRPFVATGFKAYMTQRAFFRSDLRVGVREGIDEVLLRFGFGVDF
jgi:hypothetical protein